MAIKPKKLRTECRREWQYKNPDCTWCMYKNCCDGPVIAIKDYYSPYNCPDEESLGGVAHCGAHRECMYCSKHKH